jgi:23S rRNA pseudouridine1911/1915/1917 synthase
MTLLYENADVVALDKPPGLSMATSTRSEKSAPDAVARLLAASGESPDPTLLLVHRLDVGTSGVVLLARNAAAHRALSRAFQSGGARKIYRAIVWGHPVPAKGVYADSLGRDPRDGRKMKVDPDGKRAVTRYRSLERFPSLAELELSPETGRTHQIRVHLSAHGHPIVGDDFYGGAARWHGVRDPNLRRVFSAAARPLLHAQRIAIAELSIDVEAPLPEDYRRVIDAMAAAAPTTRRKRP